MDLSTWLQNHWPELAAALGVGTGSGVLGGRWVDREQNKRLAALEEKIANHNDQLIRFEGSKVLQDSKLDAIDRRLERIEAMLIEAIRSGKG